jgi:hypothetical protein
MDKRRKGLMQKRSLSLLGAAAVLTISTTAFASAWSQPATQQTNDGSRNAPSVLPCPDIPGFDPNNFVDRIDNRYFPLQPRTVFRLVGETEDGIERERIMVTKKTKEILGVTTTVVKDVVRVNGKIAEYTFDWYAQDADGNVWYFGEDTAEYENGEIVSREGSWEAGVDGAHAGIIMEADPQVTDSCRQEYYKGEAEDRYWVVATGKTKRVPAGKFKDAVRTLEWTPLEPNIVVQKFHAPGVGLIAERALSGPKEIVNLVEVIRP